MSDTAWRRRTPFLRRHRSFLRRVAQFFRATFARVRAEEVQEIEERLSPAQAALFGRMARSDQRHCLDVYQTLCRAGYRDESLLEAALLHDVGKSTTCLSAGEAGGGRWPMTVWHRVAIVLLQAFTVPAWGTRTNGTCTNGTQDIGPRWLARLAADGRGWRAPFAVHVRHAQVGALWATEAGCSPQVVALIREHHATGVEADRPTDAEAGRPDNPLSALQWADECN